MLLYTHNFSVELTAATDALSSISSSTFHGCCDDVDCEVMGGGDFGGKRLRR